MKKSFFKNRFFCILPSWLDYSGHEASFLKSFKLLSHKSQNKLSFVLPLRNKFFFSGIEYVKNIEHVSTGYISLLFKMIKNFRTIKKYLKKKNFSNKDSIIIDGYSFDFLISFLLVFYCSTLRGKTILIYCRYNFKGIRKIIFNLFINLTSKKFFIQKILTDTKNLKEVLSKKYKNKVVLVPVPHTNNRLKIKKNKKKKYIKLYFPGQYRLEKFGANFKNFLELNNAKKYQILINNKFELNKKFEFKIKFLNNNLSNQEYINVMSSSDIIILPYTEEPYKSRTSGIFIESVILKKKILVTKNTWMANEYKRFGLYDLVIKDWSKFKLEEILKKIFSKKIDLKIKFMQKNYLKIHNENNYTKVLKRYL